MNYSCPEYIGKQNTGYHQRFTWRKGITGTVHVLTLPKGILQRRQPGNKHSIGPFLKAVKTSRNNFYTQTFPLSKSIFRSLERLRYCWLQIQRTADANKQQDIQWDLQRKRCSHCNDGKAGRSHGHNNHNNGHGRAPPGHGEEVRGRGRG